MKSVKVKCVNMVSTLLYSNLIGTQEHEIRNEQISQYGKYSTLFKSYRYTGT